MDLPALLYNHGEVHNLSIRHGTLTKEERYKINEHMVQTIIMLESCLSRVTACGAGVRRHPPREDGRQGLSEAARSGQRIPWPASWPSPTSSKP